MTRAVDLDQNNIIEGKLFANPSSIHNYFVRGLAYDGVAVMRLYYE